ncbi:hypothetical protein AB5T01_004258 [Escherichia albertii]
MDTESHGDRNRVAGRDFQENAIQIGSYDGRHTINVAIPATGEDERPLVKAQRKELNKLVSAVAEIVEEEAFVIWQKVHAEIGVASIEDMTINQYHTAVSFLHAMLERSKEKDASKALVSLLLRNSTNPDIRQNLIHYCHVNFGTGRFNDLTRSQLQMALAWLDQQSHNLNKITIEATTRTSSSIDILKKYAKEIGFIFILGVSVGAIIF